MKSNNPVKVGLFGKRQNKFDMSNTATGTLSFGHMAVSYSQVLDADESLHFKANQFVRLMPMAAPTFAKSLQLRSYGFFVPYNALYEAYDELLTGQKISTSYFTYVPTVVPHISTAWLSRILLNGDYARLTFYKANWTVTNIVSSPDGIVQYLSPSQLQQILQSKFPLDHGFVYTPTGTVSGDEITPEGADHVIMLDEKSGVNDKGYLCVRFTAQGRRLLKTLHGLGFAFDLNASRDFELLRLFAYYRAYFDEFYPQRYLTWTNTNAYFVLHYMYDRNMCDLNASDSVLSARFIEFLKDVSNCYYTYPDDYVSMQRAELNNESRDIQLLSTPSTSNLSTTGVFSKDISLNAFPFVNADNDADFNTPIIQGGINRYSLELLQRLTKYINKNTIIGQKVDALLRAHGFGNTEYRKSYCLGKFDFDISVSDINSTADTSTAALGTYTGKGIGAGRSNGFKFDGKHGNGIFIVMTTIVPEIGYFQGIDPTANAIDRFSIFNREFDSIGWTVSRKSDILTNSDVTLPSDSTRFHQLNSDESFGFIPRYADRKVKMNCQFGDVRLASTRSSLLPYTLDRYIPSSVIFRPDELHFNISYLKNDNVIPSVNWRYLNKDKWMGNLNRIFNLGAIEAASPAHAGRGFDDVSYNEDFFIFHAENMCSVMSYKVPLSKSWDTDADADHEYNVQKS
ncbi:major capsid protein [Capybara microvirus Cap1_SP_50]|nr:major capsid protein [Apis mellifera associated microvirus 55]QCS35923.1 major capsid protein [Capybara microvirus Cap1_SP_50]